MTALGRCGNTTAQPGLLTVQHNEETRMVRACIVSRMEINKIAALLLAATTLIASPAAPKEALESPASSPCNCHSLDGNDLAAWLDGLVPYALKSGDIAGGVVIVVKGPELFLRQGFRLRRDAMKADPAPLRPATHRNGARISSTSKLFTWTARGHAAAGRTRQARPGRDVNDYLDFKIPSAPEENPSRCST